MSKDNRPVGILLAKSAIAAAPLAEMQVLAAMLMDQGQLSAVQIAFSEQGEPSLREQLMAQVDAGAASILLIPMLLPMEPSFTVWLTRVLARWQREDGRDWPEIRIAPAPGALAEIAQLLSASVAAGLSAEPAPAPPAKAAEGSMVPAQKRRVLVCHGAPCTAAGAALVWGHLRNAQVRLSLRTQGDGMMSAKASCLGPCSLAPVVQVCPENSYYGGVDEAGIDAIVASHIVGGVEEEGYLYPANGKKQFLRVKPAS